MNIMERAQEISYTIYADEIENYPCDEIEYPDIDSENIYGTHCRECGRCMDCLGMSIYDF
jgi:hypothetical protein